MGWQSLSAAGLNSTGSCIFFLLPFLDSSSPSVLSGFDPRLILDLFLQRPGAESLPSLSFSFNIILSKSIFRSSGRWKLGKYVFFPANHFIFAPSGSSLFVALLYSAPHPKYVPKSWRCCWPAYYIFRPISASSPPSPPSSPFYPPHPPSSPPLLSPPPFQFPLLK